jgi:hypothetical protein
MAVGVNSMIHGCAKAYGTRRASIDVDILAQIRQESLLPRILVKTERDFGASGTALARTA